MKATILIGFASIVLLHALSRLHKIMASLCVLGQ